VLEPSDSRSEAASGARPAEPVVLERGPLRVGVGLDPFSLEIRRGGRRLIRGLGLWAAAGESRDQFIQLTEGVIAAEELERPRRLGEVREAVAAAKASAGEVRETDAAAKASAGEVRETDAGQAGSRDAVSLRGDPASPPLELRGDLGAVRLELHDERLVLDFAASAPFFRAGAHWDARPGERFTGLGARHGVQLDQTGRRVRLGADRRYTGPDCPPDMLEVGGIPQGDYAPVPWLLASRGYALWIETDGDGAELDLAHRVSVSTRTAAGPFRLHVLTDPTPAARLRRFLRLTKSLPALLPEWAYGHWKSRDVYEHQRDVEDDFDGYRRHGLPLDAIVIDSPWETQYNTWEPNPHQFDDFEGMVRRFRGDGVRTVVWVTPWVNLESADGQRPPDAESERLHREPASNYAEGADRGHYVKTEDGEPFVARWWMGTGSPVDLAAQEAEAWWREQAKRVLRLGVEGIKADDGEGYYFPPAVQFGDGRTGAEAAWAQGLHYRRSMQRALDEVHPGTGVLFGRSGWTGQQALGLTWGGDQASDFWSLQRCPRELLLRWAWFGCFTPLMQAHGRFPQEAWTYDGEALAIYREAVLLHERLVPYVRAAAATAARTGLPIVRPLLLTDPGDERGWTLSDQYGYGPALWVAPVLEDGAREREVALPRGDWIDLWAGEPHTGGGELLAPAPIERIPVYVRSGSILVTHPAEHVARGLGDTPEHERPLEATLYGEPPLGRAGVRLADGTRIRWRDGEWSVEPARKIRFRTSPVP
jgi:alpha-glucosidase (family GH31 glycosyl hydrolase)